MSKLVKLSDMAYDDLTELKKQMGTNDYDATVRILMVAYRAEQMRAAEALEK